MYNHYISRYFPDHQHHIMEILSMTTQSHVLVLRTSNHNGKAHGGFQWPTTGIVEAPDFINSTDCGNGLHGIVWPNNDFSNIINYDNPLWQVVKVLQSDIIQLNGKVKFPRGEVVYSGDFAVAFTMVSKAWTDSLPNTIADLLVNGDNELCTYKDNAQIGRAHV